MIPFGSAVLLKRIGSITSVKLFSHHMDSKLIPAPKIGAFMDLSITFGIVRIVTVLVVQRHYLKGETEGEK
jgi:hypothetical protein